MKTEQPQVRIIDAVMGTGKSTWLAKAILADSKRTIIVLPRISELERYEGSLNEVSGLVSLSDRRATPKKERFIEALRDAQVILITHSLFETHLTMDTFDIIRDGEWSLVMDEVITIFEPVKLVTGTDIEGLQAKGVLDVVKVTENVARLQVNQMYLKWYLELAPCEASKAQKRMVEEALKKDVLIVQNSNANGFPTFSLKEDRLNVFTDVTVMTYPFKDTDLDYWLQIKGYEVDHLKLTRVTSTNSLSDFVLTEHEGTYSGASFKDLIELVGYNKRGQGNVYGNRKNHFSATEYKTRFTPRKSKDIQLLVPAKNTLRREFRNRSLPNKMVEPEDFMFTCLKDCIGAWKDRGRGLTSGIINEDNWVQYSERGVNDYDHKHSLAFLYNVFPFPEVEQVITAFGLKYNRDRYALYTLIQWVWRSAIRKGEKIRLYLPSKRMQDILNTWLNLPME